MRMTLLAVLVMALVVAVGCKKESNPPAPSTGSGTNVTDQASSLMGSAQEKMSDWQNQFKDKMSDWGTKISETATKVQASSDQTLKDLQSQLSDKYDQAKTKWQEFVDASAEQKVKIQADLKDLGDQIQQLYGKVKEKAGM